MESCCIGHVSQGKTRTGNSPLLAGIQTPTTHKALVWVADVHTNVADLHMNVANVHTWCILMGMVKSFLTRGG